MEKLVVGVPACNEGATIAPLADALETIDVDGLPHDYGIDLGLIMHVLEQGSARSW